MKPRQGRSPWLLLLWLVLGVLVIAGAAVWSVGPIRPFEERVSILALGADGTFGADVRLEPLDPQAAELRFPLILGFQNGGSRAVKPIAVHLSVPARYRLVRNAGMVLDGEPGDGGPLVRYAFPMPGEEVEPDVLPAVMPGAEDLLLAFSRPSITCRLDNGVPVFAPAPPYPAEQLAQIEVFWSIETEAAATRQAGTMRLTFDPSHVRPLRANDAVFGPVVVERPDVTLPRVPLSALEAVRETTCGDPGRAEGMRSTIWTAGSGRFFILSFRESPRKYLFDLNGDGTVELEAWDIDGDGHFEARRNAAFPIPAELLPPPPPGLDTLVADSLVTAPDSAAPSADTTAARADMSQAVARDTMANDTLRVWDRWSS